MLSNALNPVPVLRRGRWWCAVALLALVVAAGGIVSSTVSVHGTPVSPIYIPLGLGVASLAVWGRSLWPGFLLGDLIALVAADDRALWVVAISAVLHLVTLVLGATLVQRRAAWIEDLGSAARYLVISIGLGVFGGLTGLLVIGLQHSAAGPYGPLGDFLTWLMGDLSGYLVGGALVIAWTRPAAAADLRRRASQVAVLGVAVLGVWLVLLPSPVGSVAGLIAVGLVAMRFGVRWGATATAVVLGALLVDAARGTGDFGGVTPDAQAFNSMLAIAITASASLLLTGYREGVGGAPLSARSVTLITSGTLLAAGVATFGSSQLSAQRGYPLATTCVFYFASAAALAMVRGARTPAARTGRRGLCVAAAAGVISAVSLALYYASLPRLGLGAGTGLAMTAPAFIVVIVAIVRRQVPTLPAAAGAVAIACGAVAITVARGGGEAGGVVLALLGALAFAIFVTVLAVALRDGSPVDLALVVALAAGIASGVLALAVEGVQGFAISPQELAIIAFGAVGSGAVPTLVRAWSLPEIGPPVVGALGVLAPGRRRLRDRCGGGRRSTGPHGVRAPPGLGGGDGRNRARSVPQAVRPLHARAEHDQADHLAEVERLLPAETRERAGQRDHDHASEDRSVGTDPDATQE